MFDVFGGDILPLSALCRQSPATPLACRKYRHADPSPSLGCCAGRTIRRGFITRSVERIQLLRLMNDQLIQTDVTVIGGGLRVWRRPPISRRLASTPSFCSSQLRRWPPMFLAWWGTYLNLNKLGKTRLTVTIVLIGTFLFEDDADEGGATISSRMILWLCCFGLSGCNLHRADLDLAVRNALRRL